MAQTTTNDIRGGMKVEVENEPYNIISNEFVKPGKGQAFNRIKMRNLITGRVIERTFKSGEKIDLADIEETKLRLLYTDAESAVFMDDNSFEQSTVPLDVIGEKKDWLMEEQIYDILFYKGRVIDVSPPTFLEMVIKETAPGVRGDTASGRVMKPAVMETGAKIQVPIFVEEGEKIKVDTRTGEYVSRV